MCENSITAEINLFSDVFKQDEIEYIIKLSFIFKFVEFTENVSIARNLFRMPFIICQLLSFLFKIIFGSKLLFEYLI